MPPNMGVLAYDGAGPPPKREPIDRLLVSLAGAVNLRRRCTLWNRRRSHSQKIAKPFKPNLTPTTRTHSVWTKPAAKQVSEHVRFRFTVGPCYVDQPGTVIRG